MTEEPRPSPLPTGPLAVIVACFFLPCARGCNEPVSPSAALTDKDLWWVFPPFVAALALGVALALPWLMARARRFETDLLPFAALGGWVVLVPAFWISKEWRDNGPWPWIAAGAPTTLLGSILLFLAARQAQPSRGWLMVGSYLAISAGYPVTIIVAEELLERPSEPLLGGVLYLSSLVALAVLTVVARSGARRRRAPD